MGEPKHPESPPPLDPNPGDDLPRAVKELERATRALLKSDWDEPLRRRAHELANALALACSAWGLPATAGIARSITCLLGLDYVEAAQLKYDLQAKLTELLGHLLRDTRGDRDGASVGSS